jgi:hypothetical protein
MAMFRNRIRRLASALDDRNQAVPPGFVAIPLQHLPPAMRQMAGCCGELYRLAFEQARASAEAAETEWFMGDIG